MEHTFRPSGWGRFVAIPFMLVWITGWGWFEWFALRIAYSAWQGDPNIVQKWLSHPMGWTVGGFMLVWLTMWTFGGVAALVTLARLIAGFDRLQISGVEWTLSRGVGPFALSKRIPSQDIRDVYVDRRNQRLMIETAERELVVTSLGTRDEKRAIASQYGRPTALDELPRGWTAVPSPEGGIVIRRTRMESPGCLLAIGIVPLLWAIALLRYHAHIPGSFIVGGSFIAIVFAAIAAWGTFRREELHVRSRQVKRIVRWLGWSSEKVADPHSLELTLATDSDGDERAELVATSGGKKLTLQTALNDARTVIRLARRIEQTSGLRVIKPHELARS